MTVTEPEVTFADIDVTDLDLYAQRFPHEWFRFLRREAPIWRHPGTPESDGEDFWLVTSHALVTEVHRAGTVFSHQTGPGRDGKGGIMVNDIDEGPGLQMVMTDPPQHTSYRKLVNSGFTPRMVRRLEESLRLRTEVILDQALAKERFDFVTEIAAELPLMAIAEIVGVPVEDRAMLFDWSNRTVGGRDEEYNDGVEDDSRNAMIEMAMYAHGLTDQKLENPGDDLWTRLTRAHVTLEDGTEVELSEMERDVFFTLLIIAGNETTRNSITKAMMAFLDHPDQWELWKAHPEYASTMVDEVLRFTSPVNYFRRTATEDTMIGDTAIAAGDKVALYYASANRDEAVFDDPDTFDITRTPNHHVAFGAGGPHYCLGANLAKLEIKVLFEELARRAPDIRADGAPERLRMTFVDGIKHFPVRV